MFHVPLDAYTTPSEEAIFDNLLDAARTRDLPRLRQELERWDTLENETLITQFSSRDTARRYLPPEFDLITRYMASHGNAAVVGYLLERGASTNFNTIMRAIRRNHWEVVKVHMDHGWNINGPVLTDNVPSLLGRLLSKEVCVRGLLELGADPNLVHPLGYIDIPNMAGRDAPPSVIKLLQEYGVDFTKTNALHEAARSMKDFQINTMIYLVDVVGVPVNQLAILYRKKYRAWSGCSGATALHCALDAEHPDKMKFLISRGADPNLKGEDGIAALDLAKDMRYDSAVALFEGNHRDSSG
ncbi:hypothetical protein ACHAPT_001393 [Fusarium lateritium]